MTWRRVKGVRSQRMSKRSDCMRWFSDCLKGVLFYQNLAPFFYLEESGPGSEDCSELLISIGLGPTVMVAQLESLSVKCVTDKQTQTGRSLTKRAA